MSKVKANELTRREREVLYAVYELGEASVLDIQEALSDDSYNAVRRVLDSMAKKDLLNYRKEGRRFIYSPVVSRIEQGTVALREVLNAFFDGSAALGFTNILKNKNQRLQELEIQNVRQLLDDLADDGQADSKNQTGSEH